MATHIMKALQTKVFQILDADAQITCEVYDHTPDNSTYPFIQIGDDAFDDFGSHDIDGFQVDMTIHTWTQGEGMSACKTLQERIYTLLHNVDLALSGQRTISLRGALTTTMLDPDGRTFHGINKFRLILGG